MKCKEIQLILLKKENLPLDIQEHLASCEECHNFLSASQRLVEASSTSVPSEAIDKAILASAREMANKQETARTIMFPFMAFQRIAVAVAAVLVCSLVLLHFNKQPDATIDLAVIDTSDEQPIIDMLALAEIELTAVEETVELENEYDSSAFASVISFEDSFDEKLLRLQCEAYFEEELLKRNENGASGDSAKQDKFGSTLKMV